MTKTYNCSGSAGTIRIGQIESGNATRTTISLLDGQFPFAEITKGKNGVVLTVVGEWEFQELVSALNEFNTQLLGDEVRSWVSDADISAPTSLA